MRILPSIFILIFSSSSLAQAECRNKIDASKIILFIDTNNSAFEIEDAQRAACDRGETLIIVSENHKVYDTYIADIKSKKLAKGNCLDCEALEKEYQKSIKDSKKFKTEQPSLYLASDEALSNIKNEKGKLKSLIISGHHGGEIYRGNKGWIGDTDISTLIKKHYEVDRVESMMPLGCYSNVQKEVSDWKNVFPIIKLIAGHDQGHP